MEYVNYVGHVDVNYGKCRLSFVKYVYDICFMFELYVQLMYVWEDEEKIDTQVCRASANGATA